MRISLLLTLVMGASTAFAQGPENVVKTNPFGYFASQYQVGFERALNDNFSVQLSAGLIAGSGETSISTVDSLGNPSSITSSYSRTGFILIPEVRYYPGGNACEGFYAALAARVRNVSTEIDDEPLYDRNVIGGALLVGFQVYKSDMLIDFFVGPQIKSDDTVWHVDDATEDLDLFNSDGRVGVRFGLNIGFGF
jgi:hypothetical protein